MPKIPSILFVARKELLHPFAIFLITLTGLLYILLLLILLNYRFVTYAFSNNPRFSEILLLFTLLGGLFTAFTPLDAFITIASAILVGINVVLIIKTLSQLQQFDNIKLSVGGAALLGLISAGCASCGFSLLSLIGLSSAFSLLPFHGMEIHLLSVGLLLFSAIYMVKKLRDSLYCVR